MKKVLWCVFFIVFLAGCAGPKFSGSAIEPLNNAGIVIVKDNDTRNGFLETIERWLDNHNFEYVVVSDNSKHQLDKLTLEYVGRWSWDLALYLREARISAYHEGQRVGEVEFKAANSLNFNKFGNAEKRISYMMDALFGERSVNEINEKLLPSQTEDTP